MTQHTSSQDSKLMRQWHQALKMPFGKRLFSWQLGRMIPYSGNLRAQILHLEPGQCQLQIQDRKALRNHLSSIHALVLANMGELASGLAMHAQLPDHQRAIATRLTTEYLKKARGCLIAEGQILGALPQIEGQVQVQAQVKDQSGDIVSSTILDWKVSPKK